MPKSRPPLYLYRNVRETVKINGVAVIFALGILTVGQLYIDYALLFYIFGCFILTSILVPFISNWWPKERIVPRGKAVFITGCDSGFGYMLAQRLDDLGFHVFAGCLFPDGEGAANLRKMGSNRIHIISIDITSDGSVQEAVKNVKENLNDSVMWAVVNNAGIASTGELALMSTESISKVIDVNTLGAIRVSKAILPELKKSKGRILVVSSFAARFSIPWMVPYCMSKTAINVFIDGLRLELYKWNVQVVKIEPAFYSTALLTDSATVSNFLEKWNGAPEEVRNMYGPKFVDTIVDSLNKNLTLLSLVLRQPDEVVSAMEDALTALHPQYCYSPGSFWVGIFVWFLHVLPKSVCDMIAYKIGNRGH